MLLKGVRSRLKELYQERNIRFQKMEVLVVEEALEAVEIQGRKRYLLGFPATLSEDEFCQYFESYGMVTDVVIMYDQQTDRPRGFGFISFDTEDAVDRVLHKTFHDLNGKQVEVKRALPKDANPGGGGRSMGGGPGGSGGGYQGYGSSLCNSSYYDARVESNRYMQSQSAAGGYPSFGSSGFNAPGYGYGPTNTAMGYGYGNYAGANPGYGGPAGAGYANLNAPAAGYGGQPNAQRNSWGSQTASGYGAYGAATGQSPSGASGYGNQGYGYAGYGGTDGGYANQADYGSAGAHAGSGPNGSAAAGDGYNYGDGSGNAGYGNSVWRQGQQ